MDDEEALARALARVLRAARFEVVVAPGGEQALELTSSGHFDVVLTDLMMPEMDGLELLRRIRELGRSVPVVIMTGNPSSEAATRASMDGAFAFLTKPLDHAELIGTLEKAVRSHRAAR